MGEAPPQISPILAKLWPNGQHMLGPCTVVCDHCGALHWPEERAQADIKAKRNQFAICCQKGKVVLPSTSVSAPKVPLFLENLFRGETRESKNFQRYVRSYNNAVSFTSLGFTLSDIAKSIPGSPVFCIQGGLSHDIGSIIPQEGQSPHFAQIFVVGQGGMREAQYRGQVALGPKASGQLQAHFDAKIILQLQTFMYKHNPYAQLFRHTAEIMKEGQPVSMVLRTIENDSLDLNRYNRPTREDVGIVVQGDGVLKEPRHIVLHHRNGSLKSISDLHSAYFPLRYPLFFPYGSQQWEPTYQILVKDGEEEEYRHVSQCEWMAYLLFSRKGEFSAILAGGALHQEIVVDMYACIEHSRLSWVYNNQETLKVQMYSGLVEAFGKSGEPNGKKIVLPSSFIGGPRAMDQLYQDAMAIVRDYGTPDLFITITANPGWKEITDLMPPGSDPLNHPTILARGAKLKFKSFMDMLIKKQILGQVEAYVATVEFQKRGMPHMHIMLTLAADSKPINPTKIDKLVQAEIPCPVSDPDLYKIVSRCMLHGPCEGKSCLRRGRCRFRYPKDFRDETILQEGAYPEYRRRDNGRKIVKGSLSYDNRNVVPYNRDLSLMMNCHVNVEVAVGIQAIKYLYKYICKGHDRSYLALECNDEVKGFVDARFIGPVEACWRIFQFELSERFPSVQRLGVHEEDAQSIFYRSEAEAKKKINNDKVSRTMLSQFFELNRLDEQALGISARDCYYHEIPKYFCWDKEVNKWRARKRILKTVGRIHFISVHQGERYYIRLILIHRKDIRSWTDLKSAHGIIYADCRAAADALGLLRNDVQYDKALKEGSKFKTGFQLRLMFAIMLVYSPPAAPTNLFNGHWLELGDDSAYTLRTSHGIADPTHIQLRAFTLHQISKILVSMGTHLEDVSLAMTSEEVNVVESILSAKLEENSLSVSRDDWMISVSLLTVPQRQFYDAVFGELVQQHRPGMLYYLDGPGGTGKTFLLNCIIEGLLTHGKSTFAVSSTGVSALLLKGGKTAHSGFKIPVKFSAETYCTFTREDQVGRELFNTDLIIWDEAISMHKDAIEAVDRSLQDLMKMDKPFGGKSVVFAGDFRQTLPVVKAGVFPRSEAATLKSSQLWRGIRVYSLKDNIRLGIGISPEESKHNRAFADELLEIGEGTRQTKLSERISLGNIPVNFQAKAKLCYNLAVRHVYQSLDQNANGDWATYARYLAERVILTTLNKDACKVNRAMLRNLRSEMITSISVNRADDEAERTLPIEALDQVDFAGFPSHRLELKIGAPIVLLRNLSIQQGLCNGTRLVIEQFSPRAIKGRILTGPFKNSEVLIPKISLFHEGDAVVKFSFYRYQFPVALSFAMTINKCQGQSMGRVALVLENQPFAHGQLYVGLSRVRNAADLLVIQVGDTATVTNVVSKGLFCEEINTLIGAEEVIVEE